MAAVTAAHEPLLWSWVRRVPYELLTISVVTTHTTPSSLVGALGREPIADVGIVEATQTFDSLMSAP